MSQVDTLSLSDSEHQSLRLIAKTKHVTMEEAAKQIIVDNLADQGNLGSTQPGKVVPFKGKACQK